MKFPDLLTSVNKCLSEPLIFADAFQSMQDARNCLEHAEGIVGVRDVNFDGALKLRFPRMKFFIMKDGQEIEMYEKFARAGETPAAKGSGVLANYKGLAGILTCGHVDTYIRSLKQPIGLVRFNRGLAEQFGTIDLDEVFTHIAGEEPWELGSDDIGFIRLPPHLVGNFAKDCVFLDIERNFAKPDPDSRSELFGVHAVFGLVEAFTGETTRENKRATTRLRGVLTPVLATNRSTERHP